MTKIDIISGFLGAGKTTLIKRLLADALKGDPSALSATGRKQLEQIHAQLVGPPITVGGAIAFGSGFAVFSLVKRALGFSRHRGSPLQGF